MSAQRGEALKAGLAAAEISEDEFEEKSPLSSADSLDQLPSGMAPGKHLIDYR